MAKKTPTNFGQTGRIDEIGFFGGGKKTVKKTDKKVTPKKTEKKK